LASDWWCWADPFAYLLDRALLQAEATVSVLSCDLDDFKLVNEEHGHEAGEVLLQRVADGAMYAAQGAGKSRAVLGDCEPE